MRRKILSIGERIIYKTRVNPTNCWTFISTFDVYNIAGKLDWIEGVRHLWNICDGYVGLVGLVDGAAKKGWTKLLIWLLNSVAMLRNPIMLYAYLESVSNTSIKFNHERQALYLWRTMVKSSLYTADRHHKIMRDSAEMGFFRSILLFHKRCKNFPERFDYMLEAAAKSGRIRMMKLLIKLCPQKIVNWNYILLTAVRHDKIRMVKFARKMGADNIHYVLGATQVPTMRRPKIQKLIRKWICESSGHF